MSLATSALGWVGWAVVATGAIMLLGAVRGGFWANYHRSGDNADAWDELDAVVGRDLDPDAMARRVTLSSSPAVWRIVAIGLGLIVVGGALVLAA